jgi:hypothetical protein
MTQTLIIEKYIYVLDKVYRCFILHCLYNTLQKENGSKERIKIATALINILIHSCQGGIRYR